MKIPKHRAAKLLSALLVAAAAASLILRPQEALLFAHDGLRLCGEVIIPSLFPFFVLSQMVVELGFARHVGAVFERVMRPLFGVGGACATALAVGLVGGYPTGAKTAVSLYENGLCSKSEAERTLAFCNNSGPAFILGVVGTGVFGSGGVGLMLYTVHIAAGLLTGVLLHLLSRRRTAADSRVVAVRSASGLAEAFASSMSGALGSTLAICSFVVFFTVVIKMLGALGVIPFAARLLARLPLADETSATQLLTGLIEISSGAWSLAGTAGDPRTTLALAAFMLGWAGLSVHCQVLSFVTRSGLSAKQYILGKLLHGLLSALLALILARPFGLL